MATRSLIAVRDHAGFKSIYVHWDGSPDTRLPSLKEHWNDPEKLEKLILLGDLSSLGEEVGEKHNFNWRAKPGDADPRDGYCRAYGRDRGEKGVDHRTHKTFRGLIKSADGYDAAYVYVYRDGEWLHGETKSLKHETDLIAQGALA